MKYIPLTALALLFCSAPAYAIMPAPRGVPAAFIKNQGQFAAGSDFALQNNEISVHFRNREVAYRFPGDPAREIRVRYPGSSPAHAQGLEPIPGKFNFLVGAAKDEWRANVPAFSSLTFQEMWPGIAVAYSLDENTLKTEFQLAPGADAATVIWQIEGVDSVERRPDGSLLAVSGERQLREAPPQVFEQDRFTGALRPVSGAFRILPHHSVGIQTGPYDRANRLIFDPVIGYSTYFGGSGQSAATAIAVDSAGNQIVTGYTTTLDLASPSTSIGSVRRTVAYVAKLTAAGNQLIFCTYLGGTLDDRSLALALDRWNNIYIAGTTSSPDFPVAAAIQPHMSGAQDAFVSELTPDGASLIFSTYFGGTSSEQAYGIAVNRFGNVYVAGDTLSTNLPVVKPFQAVSGGGQDAFLLKLGISGSSIVWSSYLGGSLEEHAAGLALDSSGNAIVTGSTYSSNFPVLNAFQSQTGGNQDAFVSKVNSAGTGLLFSTYAGGAGGTPGLTEGAAGVALDSSGNIYVAGTTSSNNFPVTAGAFQTAAAGGILDVFAMKLSPGGALVYSTRLGGSSVDYAGAIAVDTAGNAHITGYTGSEDFPSLRGVQSTLPGSYEIFLTKLNSAGSALIYSTPLGGSLSDSASALAVDKYANAVVAGQSISTDFPSTSALQTTLRGAASSVIARLPVGWKPATYASGTWTVDYLRNAGSNGIAAATQRFTYGTTGDIPVAGDWNNSGTLQIGIFRNGTWYLDSNGDGAYSTSDRSFVFGVAGDIPLVGDWDGSGRVKAGLFRNGTFILDLSGHLSGVSTGQNDVTFSFGQAGDVPVAGDWNSSGATKVGVFRNGSWLLDFSGTHAVTQTKAYGQTGDLPLVGDWDGSGVVKPGLYRNGAFLLDYNGNWVNDFYGDLTLPFGAPGASPLMLR